MKYSEATKIMVTGEVVNLEQRLRINNPFYEPIIPKIEKNLLNLIDDIKLRDIVFGDLKSLNGDLPSLIPDYDSICDSYIEERSSIMNDLKRLSGVIDQLIKGEEITVVEEQANGISKND